MQDVLVISLAFAIHQHLEESERGGCPLEHKCLAEIDIFLNQKITI